MIKKQKMWIYIFIALGLILVLTAYIYAEEVRHLTMKDCNYDVEGKDSPKTEYIRIRDCPEDLDESGPSRTVSQMINNTFYRWKEFELDDSDEFCIVMEKPEHRHLTADEAKELLEKSGKWVERTPDPGEAEKIEPTDPRLDVPPIPMPFIDEPCHNDAQSVEPDSPAPDNIEREDKKEGD